MDATLSYIKPNGDECNPGPVAGSVWAFRILPKDGVPPYTFQWNAGTATFVVQPTSTTKRVQVNVPPPGQSTVLSVTVTDLEGNMVIRSFNLTGIYPGFAAKEEAICKLLQEIAHRFRPPLYINPGDPGPLGIDSRIYSSVYLHNIQQAINRLNRQITGLQNLKH
ncbi:hypothetical protein [Mucilaginibacter sp. BT774]|uniref:hypothetical protein n=1 Tax=Mucilaginibacter sp. BT774 TaxID=3062276 RepID=UPI0026746793|nr:hypothetical protein [Mucilaginibacter sp. BT774]MDO3627477.1 hypothetical protein [Mucilaginibacter sp. BT774]